MAAALALAVTALAAVAAPAPAPARVLIGEVAPEGERAATPGGSGEASFAQLSTGTGSPAYAVPPGSGVIVRWWFHGGGSVPADDRLRLVVFRAAGEGWRPVGESDPERPSAGHPRAAPARIRVTGGDVLGLRASLSGDTPVAWPGQAGDRVGRLPAAGEGAPEVAADGLRLNVEAMVEPDADRDGRGDETQDGDDDGDAIHDDAERVLGTARLDRDSDDDGLDDGEEEARGTDPARPDTDRDRLPDGLEAGMARGVADPAGPVRGTHRARFRRDRDPATRTDPLRRDSDGDGAFDGTEDRNRDGRRQPGESDPRRRDRLGLARAFGPL